ncbi:MAG TPA: porin family protein [Alcanivoracaceae bacterium]|nr:porin family protein [Alcanivoracaceae bacterium]
MHRFITLTLFAVAAVVATPTHANNNGYASLGYAFSSIEPKSGRNTAKVSAMQFAFGGWFNHQQTFGAEGRIALGFNSDDFTRNDGGKAKLKMNRYYGGYLRAQFPNTLPFRPYGLLGLSRVETRETHPDRNRSKDYNDLSLGFGIDVDLDPNIYLYVEYLRLSDRSSSEVSNLTLGVGGRF